jgi:hypothetical protein
MVFVVRSFELRIIILLFEILYSSLLYRYLLLRYDDDGDCDGHDDDDDDVRMVEFGVVVVLYGCRLIRLVLIHLMSVVVVGWC